MSDKKTVKTEDTQAKAKRPLSSEEPDVFVLERTFPEADRLLTPSRVPGADNPAVIVALDANVLLLPYRLDTHDFSPIESVYKTLAEQNRLFVPARAVREFIRHRENKLSELIKELGDQQSRIQIPENRTTPLLAQVEAAKELADALQSLKEARKKYIDAITKTKQAIKGWSGDDPVTLIYRQVFSGQNIIEVGIDEDRLKGDWNYRLANRIPPGFKDGGKTDTGIGDFVIWSTLLNLGEREKKDMIFVTADEKGDWFARSTGEAIFARPELVDEYRGRTGKSFRLSSLHQLLSEMKVSEAVVAEVKEAERAANSAPVSASVFVTGEVLYPNMGAASFPILRGQRSFDYSRDDGTLDLGAPPYNFTLQFSKADDSSIHFYRHNESRGIGRIKNPSSAITLEKIDTSSRYYTISVGECFTAENHQGFKLIGKVLAITDDTRGAAADSVVFDYVIIGPSDRLIVP